MTPKHAAIRAALALNDSLGGIEETAAQAATVQQDGTIEELLWTDGVAICLEPFIQNAVRAALKPCRRCADCQGRMHHWIENSDFGNDEQGAEHPDSSHVCKHCDAHGNACEHCNETGIDESTQSGFCPWCDGEAVAEEPEQECAH